VRTCARLESTAAQKVSAALFDSPGGFDRLLARLDGAGSRDHHRVLLADAHAPYYDNGVVGSHFAARQFVGLGHTDDVDHSGKAADRRLVDRTGVAGDTDRHSDGAGNRMRHKTK